MPDKKQITKKQHYIPRMILKNFNYFQIPMKKPLIYQYDKLKNLDRLVNIKDVCRKNYLYELRDESGMIPDEERNLIEHCYSKFEAKWSPITDKIQNQDILDDNDIDFLYVLIVLQVLRMPEVIKLTSEYIYNTANDVGYTLSSKAADRCARIVPFICDKKNIEKNWILTSFLNHLLDETQLVIYKSKMPFLLNGDRPVLPFTSYKGLTYNWFFPIAPNYCLAVVYNNNLPLYMTIPDEFTQFLNRNIFENEGRFIYSSEPVSDILKRATQ